MLRKSSIFPDAQVKYPMRKSSIFPAAQVKCFTPLTVEEVAVELNSVVLTSSQDNAFLQRTKPNHNEKECSFSQMLASSFYWN